MAVQPALPIAVAEQPLVAAQVGGVKGGGASLTGFGHAVVEHYRAIEKAAESAGAAHVGALTASLAEPR